MHIVQLTPGAGKMYCGACFRDNALVAGLRRLGHEVTMLPLYLPLTLDESDETRGAQIFYSGINVYLEQKSALFRVAPDWFRRLFASRSLLNLAAGNAASTQPGDVGELTISMLKGEHGNQARELQDLTNWLKGQHPSVISLSNALLVGMARQIKRELNVPVICSLQGEDVFLDAMSAGVRERAWATAAERAADVDLFIAPSHYFAKFMSDRLRIPQNKIRIISNGINLDGYVRAKPDQRTPTLGYFARMCREKGMDTLVDSFIAMRQRGRVPNLRLKIGGSCSPTDQKFVDEQKAKLGKAGLEGDVEFHPNLSRDQKLEFLHSLTLFSVPAMYGEAFGLYLLEAWAAGLPVIQPRHAAFPELLDQTQGGILYDPEKPGALTEAIEQLALDRTKARDLGERGRRAVAERFQVKYFAENFAKVCDEVTRVSSRKS